MIPTKKDADKAYYLLQELTVKYNFKYVIDFEENHIEAVFENKEGVTIYVNINREADLMVNLYNFYTEAKRQIEKHYDGNR